MVYIILLQAGGRNRPVSFQAVKQTKHLVSVFTQSLFMVQSRYTHNLHICCSDTPTNQPRPESVRKPQSGRRLRCATISNGAAQNSPDWQRPGRAGIHIFSKHSRFRCSSRGGSVRRGRQYTKKSRRGKTPKRPFNLSPNLQRHRDIQMPQAPSRTRTRLLPLQALPLLLHIMARRHPGYSPGTHRSQGSVAKTRALAGHRVSVFTHRTGTCGTQAPV